MAVQREIVDKDGNRLAVVQGGAGKSAVYGKTAEGEWVPLQVDADGRAVLNVGEVSATIGVIEQGAAGEDPWLVQLSENTLSRETVVLPREVRRASTATIQVLPPNGLHPKGVSLILCVFGVTGTFGTNQGIRLTSGQTGGGYPGYGSFYVLSERLTAPGFITAIWYPGIQSAGVSLTGNSKLNIVNLPFSLGYIRLEITGDFDTGQGFDCEVIAIWWV